DKNRRPWLIADALSPGSIFKPFTAAAAMDSGKVGDKEVFHDGGSIVIGGHAITNWDGAGNGSVTLYEIMQWSSNVGFAQVGLRTGVDDFYKYLDRFGLTEPTGIDLPGEGYSILPRKDRVKDGDLARMAFGQTLAVTPISALNAIATIGNDGVRMKPHLGKEVRTPEGQLVKSIEPGPVGKVVAPDVARKVQIMMERVITQGTAGTAYVPGYRTAGKTGTAQKVVGGKVSNQVFTASFVGLTPLPNPKFAVLVMVDEPGPGVSYYGGQIAAPVYKRIMTDVFRYLQIPPDPNAPQSLQWWAEPPKPADPVPVPSLVNLPVEEAKKEAAGAGFTLRIDGAGPAVVEQVPPPGGKLIPGKSILVKTVPPEGEKAGSGDLVRVPDVRGKTMRDVANTLASVDLRLESQGTGIAIGQNPAPLALVKKGSRVTVQFEPPAPAR
ncbi:MAG: penicillin-binding transpeptidase domain-containing protein, partial [Actinobacteria bacterium]|nr:penicillin-binding transpeptidase domain-containing protein [Actinomycetota bacterium]